MLKTNVASWDAILHQEYQKTYFRALSEFIKEAYKTKICYPPKNLIMEAFRLTPLEDVKIVIIGQDPYHGVEQAHGLCFSVLQGIPHPPSLKNIFKEIKQDVNLAIPESGNLTKWAKQGVFLLNATLTVEAHKAGAHQKKGWEIFTDAVIRKLSEEKEQLIFLLWGGFAHKKEKLIDINKHIVLRSGHPSPLSANRGYWFGNKHFSKANAILVKQGKTIINW